MSRSRQSLKVDARCHAAVGEGWRSVARLALKLDMHWNKVYAAGRRHAERLSDQGKPEGDGLKGGNRSTGSEWSSNLPMCGPATLSVVSEALEGRPVSSSLLPHSSEAPEDAPQAPDPDVPAGSSSSSAIAAPVGILSPSAYLDKHRFDKLERLYLADICKALKREPKDLVTELQRSGKDLVDWMIVSAPSSLAGCHLKTREVIAKEFELSDEATKKFVKWGRVPCARHIRARFSAMRDLDEYALDRYVTNSAHWGIFIGKVLAAIHRHEESQRAAQERKEQRA